MTTRFVPAPPRRRRPGAVQRAAPRAGQGRRRAGRRPGVLVGRRRAGPRQLPRLLHDDAARAGLVVRRVLAGARAGRRDRPGRRRWPTAPAVRIDPAPTGPPSDRADRARRRSTPRPPTIAAGHRRSATHFGARSGDKGGNANVGIWARDDAGYAWLRANLTPDVVRRLHPRGRRPRRHGPRAAQPAGAQLRARRLPRRGRRQLDRVRPPGQGPRRVPPQPDVRSAARRQAVPVRVAASSRESRPQGPALGGR